MRPGEPPHLVSDALAVLRVQGTVEFVHDVERGRVDLLHGKDQAGSDDRLLATGQLRQSELVVLRRLLAVDDDLFLLLRDLVLLAERDTDPDAGVGVFAEGHFLRRKLRGEALL